MRRRTPAGIPQFRHLLVTCLIEAGYSMHEVAEPAVVDEGSWPRIADPAYRTQFSRTPETLARAIMCRRGVAA